MSDRDREMLTLQLRRRGRDVGAETTAWLDLRDDAVGGELRRYLRDAAARERTPVGECELQVWRGNRLLRTFVTIAGG